MVFDMKSLEENAILLGCALAEKRCRNGKKGIIGRWLRRSSEKHGLDVKKPTS